MGNRTVATLVACMVFGGCAADEGGLLAGGAGSGGASSSWSRGSLASSVATGASARLMPDGRWLVVDTERHMLRSFARDAATGGLTPAGSTGLPAGSRPTWLAGRTRFVLVLRGSGQVTWVSASGATSKLIDVCPEVRGAELDARETQAVVACASGELVTVDSGGVLGTIDTGLDLRDVVRVDDATVWVTTWRTAQLLELDRATGKVATQLAPFTLSPGGGLTFSPHVAARTIAVGDDVFMVHQAALDQDVSLLNSDGGMSVVPRYYGTLVLGTCLTSVVSTAITHFDLAKKQVLATSPIRGSVPVDIASDGSSISIVSAGTNEVLTLPVSQVGRGCTTPVTSGSGDGPLGVALDQSGPVVLTANALGWTPFEPTPTAEHPARALFRTQSPSGVACQSCHADGHDDGHTWVFDHAPVRTQSLEGGLLATAPFHWQGELSDLSALVHATLETRMGGALPKGLSAAELGNWLDQLPARKKTAAADTELIRQGEQIFQQAGCPACHSGPAFTNNSTVDVGTGGKFQVPTLRGVGFRGPWMHSGCAKTLEDRFVAGPCGGTAHPRVSASAVAPLVRYLKSL